MGVPNITDLPPTMETDPNWGSRINNPTSVAVEARSGEAVNPQNTNGSNNPMVAYPFTADDVHPVPYGRS